jgi:hypothetical protein
MKKLITTILLFFFVGTSFGQQNSITLSPGSLFLARFNLKYEKLTAKKLTYGSRLEYSTAWKSLMVVPYGRVYPFSSESTGLFTEFGAGFRSTNLPDFADINFGKFAPVARLMIGAQWFGGKKNNIPFEFGLGLNIDPLVFGNVEETDGGSALMGLVGPFSIFNFRLQTGLAW